WRFTNACLKALAAAHDAAIPTEILVVDDASTDATEQLLAACEGIRVVKLQKNVGFVGASNAGAGAARGRYIHFLNNDTIVTDGYSRALLDTFDSDSQVGAAVSQLLYPGGRLCEAGAIIWDDGHGWNYGRGDSPHDWRYRTVRAVDYGSAASLVVRKDAFDDVGGFDASFAPAYYEDADLCFKLRQAGWPVVYQPHSVVYHREGSTYGSNVRKDANILQNAHRLAFTEKWREELSRHFSPNRRNVDVAARRLAGAPTMLIADE